MPRNVLEGNRELSKCGLQAREGGAEAFELISKVGVSGLIAVVEEWTGLSVCSCSTCTYCYAITEPHLYIILAAIVDERCAWIRLVEHDCSASDIPTADFHVFFGSDTLPSFLPDLHLDVLLYPAGSAV